MKQTNKSNLVSWIILLVLGILLIVGQKIVKKALYIVFAIGLILAAIAGVIGWWKDKERRKDAILNLLGCLAMLGVGIWILVNPTAFDALLNVLIGLVLMVIGVQWLIRGYKLGKDVLIMVLGGISVALGLIIACSKFGTSWAVIAEGIGLIYTAISGFIAEKRFAK